MSGVLVDTSVWVDHFRVHNEQLAALLQADRVWVHPLVIGEIACGTPPARAATLQGLAALQTVLQPTVEEVLALMQRDRLFGSGCGFVDICLLASGLMTPGLQLWTLDARLARLAQRYRVAFAPSLHEPAPEW